MLNYSTELMMTSYSVCSLAPSPVEKIEITTKVLRF